MSGFLDACRFDALVSLCACGMPATAGTERGECPDCFRARLGSVRSAFAPTRSLGAGKMLGATPAREWESRLEDYRKVRAEGSQPPGTTRRDVELTKRASDIAGAAVDAGPYARVEKGVA